MIKNYTTKQISTEDLHPSDQTIQFLLNYSKSFKVFKTKENRTLEVFSN